MRSTALLVPAAAAALLAASACGTDKSDAVIACTNPVAASDAPAERILLHVANVRVGTPLSFIVPANTASLTIIEQAVTAPATVTITSPTSSVTWENEAVPLIVADPSGRTVYDHNQNFPGLTPEERQNLLAYVPAPGAGAGALIIPTTTGGLGLVSATGLPAGTWSLLVSDLGYECAAFDWSPNTCRNGSRNSLYDVTVVAKPLAAGAIPTAGTLDVVVHFATRSAGGGALSAATANAGQDQDLGRMATTLRDLLAKAGLTMGSITYVDLPDPVVTKYSRGVDVGRLDPCADLGQLFRYGQGGNALNVFLVSAITGSSTVSGKTVVALDGAIPGPATVGRTTESGIVAATVNLRANRSLCAGGLNLQCGADQTAYYIAHEGGHYLGLSHPTELYGYRFDALADTPRCPCSTCKAATTETCATGDGDASTTAHTMTVTECTRSTTCGGGDNLMFWTLFAGTSRGNLTPEQKQIILANPLVQ